MRTFVLLALALLAVAVALAQPTLFGRPTSRAITADLRRKSRAGRLCGPRREHRVQHGEPLDRLAAGGRTDRPRSVPVPGRDGHDVGDRIGAASDVLRRGVDKTSSTPGLKVAKAGRSWKEGDINYARAPNAVGQLGREWVFESCNQEWAPWLWT